MYDLAVPSRIDRFIEVPRRHRPLAQALSAPPSPIVRPPGVLVPALQALRRCLIPIICLLSALVLVLIGSDRAQLLVPAAILALIGMVEFALLGWQVFSAVLPNIPTAIGCVFGFWAWDLASAPNGPDDRTAAVIIGVLAVVLIAAGLLLHRLTDWVSVGLQGALTTVIGQTIRPAPWVDQLPGSHLVLVSTGELGMLSFGAAPDVVEQAMFEAEIGCGAQLDRILADGSSDLAGRVAATLSAGGDGWDQRSAQAVLTERFPDHRIG